MTEVTKGPRIAVLGYCQTDGMRDSLSKLCPNADVQGWRIGVMAQKAKDEIAEQLGGFDLIVSQAREPDGSALNFDRLRDRHKKAVFFPTMLFNGFQPDCIYLRLDGQFVTGALFHMHSAIIAAGFSLGLSQKRVLRLFNALTYEALGYFDAFAQARAFMLSSFSAAGFDLRPYVKDWRRTEGCFMYTLNHPHICVLARLAHMIGVRTQLVDPETPVPDDVPDVLSDSLRWPVYPELAARLGVPVRDIVFKPPVKPSMPAADRDLTLQALIAREYEHYDIVGKADIRSALTQRIMDGMESVLA